MSVIVTCGHLESGFESVRDLLMSVGIQESKPSKHERVLPDQLHAQIFDAYDLNIDKARFVTPLNPGKMWQYLAIDLFIGNMDQKAWGWGDAKSLWLLDFWKEQDSQVNFVLVYSAPELVVANYLMKHQATASEIDAVLGVWIAYQTEMLRFYKANSPRCLLVNAADCVKEPLSFINRFRHQFSIKISNKLTLAPLSQDTLSIIAAKLVKDLLVDSKAAKDLYDECERLAAHVNQLSSPPLALSGYTVFESFRRLCENHEEIKIERDNQIKTVKHLESECLRLGDELQQLTRHNLEQASLEKERTALLHKLIQERDQQLYLSLDRRAKKDSLPHLNENEAIQTEEKESVNLHLVKNAR